VARSNGKGITGSPFIIKSSNVAEALCKKAKSSILVFAAVVAVTSIRRCSRPATCRCCQGPPPAGETTAVAGAVPMLKRPTSLLSAFLTLSSQAE